MTQRRFDLGPLAAFAQRGFLGCLICALCSSGKLTAALDAETNKPYHLQVVLHFSGHRWLTDPFQKQIKRELHDGLQAALGDLAEVEVRDHHPRLKEVETNGLRAALDSWNFLSDEKLHFLFIDFVDGQYEIQSRQYDGFVGLASPTVRHAQVADRQLVARQASLLIDQDFGLAGTINLPKKGPGDIYEIALKGGSLGPFLGHWLKKGDILAISQISNQGSRGGLGAVRMPWTLLQATQEPQGASCTCQLLYRHQNPLPMLGGVLGYRCIKLGTIDAPLRLRLVGDKDRRPLSGREVSVSAKGFTDLSPEQVSTDSDGRVGSSRIYNNVAFVTVSVSGQPLARIPLEIVDDRTVTVAIPDNPEMERLGQLYLSRDRWNRHLSDSLETASTRVRELNAIPSQRSEEALSLARAGLKAIDNDIAKAMEERDSIQQQYAEITKDAKLNTRLDLTEGNLRLQDLQTRRGELDRYVSQVTKDVETEKDPKVRKMKADWAAGQLREASADFDGAIKIYEQVVADGYQEGLQQLNALKEAWKLHGQKHVAADKFIYETWPKLERIADIYANLPKARNAFQTCVEEGDYLRPRKLLLDNVALTGKMEKEVAEAPPGQDAEDTQKTVQMISKLTDGLTKLSNDIGEYLRKNTPKKK
ncbi:MAG TPA: hypothetical protein VK395_29910 [Gemmataceae bacterium]|nr:hypothetical protein [Gemmataceae bacterium]